jgi:hypothetical protein
MVILYILLGFILGSPGWVAYWFLRRDYIHVLNEFSIRTGGRKVYREQPKEQNRPDIQVDRTDFCLMTPSMAEADAEAEDEKYKGPVMTQADMEHLRRQGIIQ